jgi:hypothetical protein
VQVAPPILEASASSSPGPRIATPAPASGQPAQTFGESLLAVSRRPSATNTDLDEGARAPRRQKIDARTAQTASTADPAPVNSLVPQATQQYAPVIQPIKLSDPVFIPAQPSPAPAPASSDTAGARLALAQAAYVPAEGSSTTESKMASSPATPEPAAQPWSRPASIEPMASTPMNQDSNPESAPAPEIEPGISGAVANLAASPRGSVMNPMVNAAADSVSSNDGAGSAKAPVSTVKQVINQGSPTLIAALNPAPREKATQGAAQAASAVTLSTSAIKSVTGSESFQTVTTTSLDSPFAASKMPIAPLAQASAPAMHISESAPVKPNGATPSSPDFVHATATTDGSKTTPPSVPSIVPLATPVAADIAASVTNKVAPVKTPQPADFDGDNSSGNSLSDGPKQHLQASSSPVNSQDAAPGSQTQGNASSPDPSTAPPSTPTSHAGGAMDHVPETNNAPAMQILSANSPQVRDVSKPAETPIPSAGAMEQSLPTINSARLIQTMGQSEMRVGLHTSDFGNISISTSATRDMVSAQILLDHGELAKTLVAHLPEIQARLGADGPLQIRVDMNGQAANQGGGTSQGLSQSSAGSNADRQQKGGSPYQPADIEAQPANFISLGGMPTIESGLPRLDIRV